jgi:uncharacterized membrane protein
MSDEAHEQIRVAAPPGRCFGFAADFEEYPSWAKDVKEVTVVECDEQGRGARVEYRASALGRTIRYVLDYDFAEAPLAFAWTLAEGDMLRALDGSYRFAPDGDGTLVTYDLRIDLSVPMPGMLKRRAGALIVHTALEDLKRAAEAS